MMQQQVPSNGHAQAASQHPTQAGCQKNAAINLTGFALVKNPELTGFFIA
jgi:hypothetical protein